MGCVLLLRACAHRCMIRDALNTLASLINRIIRISLNERAIGPIEKMSGIIIIITSNGSTCSVGGRKKDGECVGGCCAAAALLLLCG